MLSLIFRCFKNYCENLNRQFFVSHSLESLNWCTRYWQSENDWKYKILHVYVLSFLQLVSNFKNFFKYASLKNDVKYLYFSFHNTEILETSTGTFQISCKPFIVTCTLLSLRERVQLKMVENPIDLNTNVSTSTSAVINIRIILYVADYIHRS